MKQFFGKKLIKPAEIFIVFVIITSWIFFSWPQIWQFPPIPPEVQEVQAEVAPLQVNNKLIDFSYTDDNSNESLIIKTDKKTYIGLARSEVYFSVTNIGDKKESVNFQVYFPADNGGVKEIKKWTKNIPYKINVPEYDSMSYFCEEGWQEETKMLEEIPNQYRCQATDLIKDCDSLNEDNTECTVNKVQVGSHQETKYRDNWQSITLSNNPLLIESGFFDKLLGDKITRKSISENQKVKKSSVGDGHIIEPNQTQYFKMDIEFPPKTSGEFYIEAIGNKNGYGLLDPWWDSSWVYRKQITIDHDRVGIISDLSSNASSGQKDVVVDNGSIFSASETVVIKDDNNEETATISSVSSNTLTMQDNLTNSYTTAANAFVKNTTDSTNLSNFPMLISLASDASLAANAQNDGDDIAFTDNSENQLDHEIANFIGDTGELQVWVEVTTLSASSDTIIYMYYGNAACGSQEDANGVWDSNFKGIWHMDESSWDGTANEALDMSGYENHGKSVDGANTTDTNYKFGTHAYSGDDTTTHLYIDSDSSLNIQSAITMVAWIYPNDTSTGTIIGHNYQWQMFKTGSSFRGYFRRSDADTPGSYIIPKFNGAGITTGEWQHIAMTLEPNSVKAYRNGVLIAETTDTGCAAYGNCAPALALDSEDFAWSETNVGIFWNESIYPFNGEIDEVRVSDIVRGLDWIKTSYDNQNSPSSFYSLGSEEAAPAISISLNTDGAVAFGFLELNSTQDNTASGINDVEVISIDNGPADLDIKSSTFTEGGNTWILAATNGSNQVQWEFASSTSNWVTFSAADTNYEFDVSVAEAQTRNINLRLTMPTVSDSVNQYSSTVTITASTP